MLAPQLGYGAFVLLLSPDHTGTEVPLLLGWLLLDLAPRRWWVPALLGLLLAWVQFADRAAVLTAVVPLTVVCLMLAGRARAAGGAGRSRRLAVWRERWFELSLAAAAVASAAVSWLAARLLTAAGGFTAHPLPLTLSPPRLWWTHARLTGWGILELYGANFTGVSGWVRVSFAALHLVGLALGAAGCALALRRLGRHVFRWRVAPTPADDRTDKDGADDRTDRGEADGERDENAVLVDSVLAVAIVCNLLSYILSIEPGTVPGTGYNAREIAAVLPLGAVLAGRLIGPRLAARLGRSRAGGSRAGGPWAGGPQLGQPGLAVWAGRRRRAGGRAGDGLAGGESARPRSGYLALGVAAVLCYGAALGYGAAQPAAAGPDASLAGWLAAHHLRYGLAGPEGNVITVDSGGRVRLAFAATGGGRVAGRLYQSERSWYDPWLHDATFVISSVPPGTAAYLPGLIAATDARRTFGPPARVYHFHGYTVMTWNANLLKRLRRPM